MAETEPAAIELIGFEVIDQNNAHVGVIEAVLDRSVQPLLQVHRDPHDCLIPWVEEWIMELDPEGRRLVLHLPDGLIDIN